MKANISRQGYDEIIDIMTSRGIIPTMDADIADAGYMNVVIGVAPPSLFGHELTLVVDPEAREYGR